jgi:iron complex outermembrane receptor protein
LSDGRVALAAHPLFARAALALALPAGHAQSDDRETAPALEKVEVVGSHLKRVEQEGSAPVSSYTRDDIEASGATRLVDFLLKLPFNSAGSFDDRATAFNFLTGAAALSLRGLGPVRRCCSTAGASPRTVSRSTTTRHSST